MNGGFSGEFINSHRYHCYYYHNSVNYAFHEIAGLTGCSLSLSYTLLNGFLRTILRKPDSFVLSLPSLHGVFGVIFVYYSLEIITIYKEFFKMSFCVCQ